MWKPPNADYSKMEQGTDSRSQVHIPASNNKPYLLHVEWSEAYLLLHEHLCVSDLQQVLNEATYKRDDNQR